MMSEEMWDPLTHRVRVSPDATALVEAATGEEQTYADLDAAVDRTAGRLAALGVGTGDHLGAVLETRVAFVRLVHAAMRLGAVLVPLNARLAPAELAERIERTDLSLLVCGADTEDAAAEAVTGAAGDVPVVSVDDGRVETLGRIDPVAVEPAAWGFDDPQVVVFTSGTTGRPKAVVLAAGNLVASAVASAFRLGVLPGDRWHLCLSMYHVGGLAPVLRATLYGTAVVVQSTRGGFDPEATLAALFECESTCVSLVPTMLRRLLDAGTLPDLRFVLLGGAPAPEELVERCERRGVPVCPTYGMTETASQVATARPAEAVAHPGTVGRPLLGTEVAVVDDGGEPLGPGEPGEFVVSGPTVTPGYHGSETPFGEHGLHTGDVGYRDEDGRLWVLNRKDDRIVTGGENVDPGEVVAALREHPRIEDAAVVGLEDPEWGERVAALVVGGVTTEEVEAHCRERLAGYKVPRTVGFAGELPRTASGTVDRGAVRERLR